MSFSCRSRIPKGGKILLSDYASEGVEQLSDVTVVGNKLSKTKGTFKPKDVGKVVYIYNAERLNTRFKSYIGYKGDVKNFKSLPTPQLGQIYSVFDASDDPYRKLIGEQFYGCVNGKTYSYLKTVQDVATTILNVNKDGTAELDFNGEGTGKSTTGMMGQNNLKGFTTFLQKVASTNGIGIIDGTYLLFSKLLNTPTLNLNTTGSNFTVQGTPTSKLYFLSEVDNASYQTDLLKSDNEKVNEFITLEGDMQAKSTITISNLNIAMNEDLGFRNIDARNKGCFGLYSGRGSFTIDKCTVTNGDRLLYSRASYGKEEAWSINISNSYYSAKKSKGEVAIAVFGKNALKLTNSTIEDIGAAKEWSFNGKARGISGYIHPELSVEVQNCTFRNIYDRWQFYSGGGKDVADIKGTIQKFENCRFIADNASVSCGIYTSRVHDGLVINNCEYKGINGGEFDVGVYVRGGLSISNSTFNGCKVALTNASLNNQKDSDSSAIKVISRKNVYVDSRIDVYGSNKNVRSYCFQSEKDVFVNSTRNVSGESIRFLGGEQGFEFHIQEGIFNGEIRPMSRLFFFEPSVKGTISISNSQFNVEDEQGRLILFEQLRGDELAIRLIGNRSESEITISNREENAKVMLDLKKNKLKALDITKTKAVTVNEQ